MLVRLLNEARVSEWSLVEDYLKQHATAGNSDVRRITNIEDAVRVSKLLRSWVDNRLLLIDSAATSNRQRRYRLRPAAALEPTADGIFTKGPGK